ncbi:alpha-hydroxy-acid oxidizing protein, partial [Xanthomonas translucens]|uniref:alpha-hydroxy-acid oxidizing protein n=2 Tax=Xanthomonas translucens group TaxID=3390202 RepID=UPI00073C0B4A
MQTLTCLDDIQALARSRVPRMFYDYATAGSWSQSTVQANRRDFDALALRQRIGCDVSLRSTATLMLGQPVAMPVALAPTG